MQGLRLKPPAAIHLARPPVPIVSSLTAKSDGLRVWSQSTLNLRVRQALAGSPWVRTDGIYLPGSLEARGSRGEVLEHFVHLKAGLINFWAGLKHSKSESAMRE